MARPEAFDSAPKRRRKNPQGVGKRYEQQVYAGLQSIGWAARFPDVVGVDAGGRRKNMAGAKTPADFIFCSPVVNLLVECKAQMIGAPIRFDRLAPHQREALVSFHNVSKERHVGIVAVCWYNGQLGAARVYRSWTIPISEWELAEQTLNRKSIPMSHFETEWGDLENSWVPGSNRMFDISTVVSHIGRR